MAAFRRLGEREVYAGFPVVVAVATTEAVDGTTFERHVVRHPGAVAVLPLHEDRTVTLVRQYRAPLDREVLEVPAGLRDVAGERPEVTAGRELAEETGLRASRLEHLVTFHASPGFCDEEVIVYVATGLTPTERDLQGAEEQALTVVRVALADAVAAVRSGTVTDAKTMIALLLVAGGTPRR